MLETTFWASFSVGRRQAGLGTRAEEVKRSYIRYQNSQNYVKNEVRTSWICVFDEEKRWIRIYRGYVPPTKGNDTLYIVNMCLRRRETVNHTLRSSVLASITAKPFGWGSQKLRFTLRSFELASNLAEGVSNFDIRYEAPNSFICSTYMALVGYDFYKKGSLEASKKGSLEASISKGECWNFRCDLVGNLRIHSAPRSSGASEFRGFRVFDLPLTFSFLRSSY